MYRANVRGRLIVVTLISGLLLTGALWAAVHPELDPLDLRFRGAGDSGFKVQGSLDGSSDVIEQGLSILMTMGDQYIEMLNASQGLGPVNGSVQYVPLVHASVYTDPSQPNTTRTTIIIADNEVEISGGMVELPAVDVPALVENLTGDLLRPPGEGDDDEGPGEGDDPDRVFPIGDDNHTYAYLILHGDGTVELIINETPGFSGLRIVANPWFVEHSDGDGNVIDLWVRNPFQAVELEDRDPSQEVECEGGQCKAKKTQQNCREERQDCRGRGKHQTSSPEEGGHTNDLPDTILHVWANDTMHGGAGINILDTHEAALAGSDWYGNPFTSQGLWVEHDGGLVASLHIELPGADHPGLGITVGGPVVEELHGAPVTADGDLSALQIDLAIGDLSVSSDDLYAQFDALNAVLVGTWSDSSGSVHGMTFTHLLSGEPILSLVPGNHSDVHINSGLVNVSITEDDVIIEPAHQPILGPADQALDPATTALAQLRDLVTGEVRGEVRAILGAAGCGDTVIGCVGIVYDTATTTIGDPTGAIPGNPVDLPPLDGSPDNGSEGDPARVPEVSINDIPVPGAQRYVQWINSQAGTVIGYVPGPDTCNGLLALDVDECLATAPDPLGAAGVVVGLIGDPDGGIAALPTVENDHGDIHIHDGDGQTLVRVSNGDIQVAGATASWGDDIVTVRGPDGTTICIQHTAVPPTDGSGTLPSLTVACDGLDGQHYTIQPGSSYQLSSSGELNTLTIHDPTDPGSYLFYYHNDGTTTTISSGLKPVGTIQVPSTLVHVIGNPVTSSTFGIVLAGEPAGDQMFDSLSVAKQLYHDGRALVSSLPAGSQLQVVFDEVEAPDSTVRVSDGKRTVAGSFGGSTWTSGLRDHTVTVKTTAQDAPERLDVVYDISRTPTHGTSPQVELVLVGTNDETDTHTYQGNIPATAFTDATDGATLRFALAWTDRIGPLATTQWDDNDGADYRYKLDMTGPTAGIDTPDDSSASTFTVGWSASNDAGSALDSFRIETSEGTSAGADGWTTWIDGRAASAARQADFQGTPGATHWFRAQACDLVGNCGAWTTPSATLVTASSPGGPQPSATLTIEQPAKGAILSGVAALAWTVDYDGDATPVTNLHYQAPGTTEWTSITSAQNGAASWDTRDLQDGAYILRFHVTDGANDWKQKLPVTLQNGNVPDNLDDLRDAVKGETNKVEGDPNQKPGERGDTSDKKESPGLGVALLVGLLGTLAIARRRREAR